MTPGIDFGVVDKRFLARSLGTLNPLPAPILPLDASVDEAIQLLQSDKLGAVVICAPNGKLEGIFTERDVVLKVCLSSRDIKHTDISEVMTRNPQSAEMTTSIAFALSMMSEGGYRHIPITDDKGVPVGLITVKNIVDYIVSGLINDLRQIAD